MTRQLVVRQVQITKNINLQLLCNILKMSRKIEPLFYFSANLCKLWKAMPPTALPSVIIAK